MHDIDRTQLEFSQEMAGFQSEQFEYGAGETEWSGESVLSEADEIQLAGELLEVTNEAELDRFLGDFIKKVGSVAGQVIRSPIGQAVGGVLKGVAKKALPLAGGAIGAVYSALAKPASSVEIVLLVSARSSESTNDCRAAEGETTSTSRCSIGSRRGSSSGHWR